MENGGGGADAGPLENELDRLDHVEGLVDLRLVDQVRAGSPVLSPSSRRGTGATRGAQTGRDEDEKDNAGASGEAEPAGLEGAAGRDRAAHGQLVRKREYERMTFDPWSAKPLDAGRQNVFVETRWVRFRKLAPETNLLMLPATPGWAADGPTAAVQPRDPGSCPQWTRLWRHTKDGEDVDWEEDTWWLLEHAFRGGAEPDFIGSSQVLKELFTIPYTNDTVSLLVYRAGGSVFVGGASDGEYAAGELPGPGAASFVVPESLKDGWRGAGGSARDGGTASDVGDAAVSKSALPKRGPASGAGPPPGGALPHAVGAGSGRTEPAGAAGSAPAGRERVLPSKPGENVLHWVMHSGDSSEQPLTSAPPQEGRLARNQACGEPPARGTGQNGGLSAMPSGREGQPDAAAEGLSEAELLGRFHQHLAASLSGKVGKSESAQHEGRDGGEPLLKEEGDEPEAEHVPRFRRTLSWSFDGMELVVGSNLRVFRDEEDSPVSAQLHDASKALSDQRCLDYYLDNRLAGVPRVALCLHQGGRVRDFRVYDTDDIPTLTGQHIPFEDNRKLARAAFSPRLLEQRAAQLLHFLKERLAPGHTYWLFKGQNSNVIHLCELSPASATTQRGRERWMYTMAMLCYRVALQYASKRREFESGRARVPKGGNAARRGKSSGATARRDRRDGKRGSAYVPDDPSEPAAHAIFLLVRERELVLKSLELLQEILADGGPPRLVLQAKLNEQVAETYIAEAEILRRQAAETWKAEHQVHPNAEFTVKIRFALAHWQFASNCLWAYRRACVDAAEVRSAASSGDEEQGDMSGDDGESGGNQPTSETRERSSPEAELALAEIQSRLQSRVFFCFLIAAHEHQRVGNLDKVVQTVEHGLLCSGTFDQWWPQWPRTHEAADLGQALLLLGDVLLETSKRAVHSANLGPSQRSTTTWTQYSSGLVQSLERLVGALDLGQTVLSAAPKHEQKLSPDSHAENIVSAERIGLAGVRMYELAGAVYAGEVAREEQAAGAVFGSGEAAAGASGARRARRRDHVAHGNDGVRKGGVSGVSRPAASGAGDSGVLGESKARWKLGNAWNEVGKLRFVNSSLIDAKQAFVAAVEWFRLAGDAENAALVYLNLNHMFRSLGFSCGAEGGKSPRERLEAQRLYIEEGLQFLNLALGLFTGANGKAWVERIKLEQAMSHLALGAAMRMACKGATAASVRQLDSMVLAASQQATAHLNAALHLYESLKSQSSVAQSKAGAVHFHIGSHFAWVFSFGDAQLEQSLLGRADTSRTGELAKRHFVLALKTLTGDARELCKREFQELLAASTRQPSG